MIDNNDDPKCIKARPRQCNTNPKENYIFDKLNGGKTHRSKQ